MKKTLISFILILIFLSLNLLTGCINSIKIPIGNRPTKQFTIVDYVQDDAVFQAKSKLKISGLSEEGVIIVATLYDNKGDEVTQAYSNTNENGIWNLEFDTPSASMKTYTLKIADSIGVYHHTFTEIKFGQVWLMLGDEIKNQSVEDEGVEDNAGYNPTDYNRMFYYKNKWVAASEKISEFGYKLIEQMTINFTNWNKYPIGIVFATSEETNIYSWLSRDIIESRKIIKDYLTNKGIYELDSDEPPNNLYDLTLKNLENMSYSNIIFNQGMKDIRDLNDGVCYNEHEFKNIYSLMIYSFISSLDNNIEVIDKFYIIQAASEFMDNVNILRNIQTGMSNYFNKCETIPTYDITLLLNQDTGKYLSKDEYNLVKDTDKELNLKIVGVNFEKLVERVYNFSVNKESAPRLNDVVQEYGEDNQVKSIRLIFKNTKELDEVDNIIGLEFIDENGELIEVEYEIRDNEILVDLANIKVKNSNIEDDTNGDNLDTDKYVKIVEIRYGQYNFIYDNNLSNGEVGVIPFEIIIK